MRKAEPLAGLGGLALLVSLFLPWFDSGVAVRTVGSAGSERTDVLGASLTGWQALTVVDVLLALLALLALAVPLVSLATTGPAKSIGTALLASALGWLAPLLVAIELLTADGGIRYGAWLALAGSILAWVGSWLSLRDESTPGAVPPDVPRLSTPAA
jgi:hypothetical protein